MSSVEEVVRVYLKARDKKRQMEADHKERMKPLNDEMAKLENWLQKKLNEAGADHIGTKYGTAYESTRTSVRVQDWEAVLQFILAHDLTHMLERRVSKAAVEEFLDAQGELPPGLSIDRAKVVNIRSK